MIDSTCNILEIVLQGRTFTNMKTYLTTLYLMTTHLYAVRQR